MLYKSPILFYSILFYSQQDNAHWPDLIAVWLTSLHRVRGWSTDRRLCGLAVISMPFDTALCRPEGRSSCTEVCVLELADKWLEVVVVVVVVAVWDCRFEVYVRRTMNTTSSHAINTRWRSISYTHSSHQHKHWLTGAVVCLHAAMRVQLFGALSATHTVHINSTTETKLILLSWWYVCMLQRGFNCLLALAVDG